MTIYKNAHHRKVNLLSIYLFHDVLELSGKNKLSNFAIA
jgi:hypothetical protein